MPGKKKKYNARFPPARIKKIMQSDEEVGKVAAAVPVIISRALELFVNNLLRRANDVATRRNARTLTPSHLKLCINSDTRFDFLKDLVSNVADLQGDVDDTTPLMTPLPSVTAPADSQNPFQFPIIGVGHFQPKLEDNKFLQSTAEPQDFSITRRRSPPTPVAPGYLGHHHQDDVPMDLTSPTNSRTVRISRESSGPRDIDTTIPSTSTGKKRGRPKKMCSLESGLKPKKNSSASGASGVGTVRSHQYYSNGSNFENAKNVGRVCDEDEDDLGVSGDEDAFSKSGKAHLNRSNSVEDGKQRHYQNGTAEQQKPMQNFVLSMKNGTNGEEPSFVLLPQLGHTDKSKKGCDDEDSNALVVDEDYDC